MQTGRDGPSSAQKFACYLRPRVFVAPRETLATSPPYRAAHAPDDFPFLKRFQHASRKVREDFTFANGQADEALPIRAQHLSRHPALADLLARYATGALTHAQFKRSMLFRALPVYVREKTRSLLHA